MARLSLSLLLLLSLLSVSFARDLSQLDSQPEPTFLRQLPNPESESEREPLSLTEIPELPIPEQEERRESEIPELPTPEPEEKPEYTETVQYIVLPVHQLQDAIQFDNIQDIGFSLRLPMRHGHRHHRHRFGGFGHRFGPRFGHRFHHRFPAQENQMEGFPAVNDEEGRKREMPEMPEMHMQMKEDMEVPPKFFFNYDKTQMPMTDEEKIEIGKDRMKRMRKCKHHHMEKGMHWHHDHHHEHHHEPREEMRDEREGMHWHHGHHHEHHHEPREEMRDEREEGGFMQQLFNLFNF